MLIGEVKYGLNLIQKNTETDEEQVIESVKENSDKTYFEYAINVDGENKAYVKSEEDANQLVESLQNVLGNSNISVKTIYTKQLDIEENIEIAEIVDQISSEIKQKEKVEASTINGVYLAVTPVSGHITSRYGVDEPIRDHTHQGLDIGAKTGTDIKATSEGTVSFSGTKGGYGNLIIINHGNGIETYYGHCSKLYAQKGDKVNAGDVIAAVGSTGNSTGPHLHFEIRKNGEYIDPQEYLYND